MIPPSFEYEAPTSVEEAIALLGQNPEAKILAGGQSLIPLMKLRLASPALLVDINRIEGLSGINESNGWLSIGAMTRESELETSEVVKSKYPLLADTSRVIADPLVRNQSTIGGNLAHADPANDHPAAMLAYGAELVATGPKGERTIRAYEFFVGPFETALASDEILTEIRIPAANGSAGGAYKKLERKVGDFATAAVAAQVRLGKKGVVEAAGIGLTNVGLTPIEASEAEASLTGKKADDEAIAEAAQLASEAAQPESDPRGSVEYKRALVRTLTNRALATAVERAQGG